MLCWRRISAIGTPASPCFRISTIWLSVNRDFRMGISLAPESLRSKCLLKGEAYAPIPEGDVRTSHQILDSIGYEDLTRLRCPQNTGAGIYGDPAYGPIAILDLTSMYAD